MTPISIDLILNAVSIAFFTLVMFLLAKASTQRERIEVRTTKNSEVSIRNTELIQSVKEIQVVIHAKLNQLEEQIRLLSLNVTEGRERGNNTRQRLDRIEDKLDTAIGTRQ